MNFKIDIVEGKQDLELVFNGDLDMNTIKMLRDYKDKLKDHSGIVINLDNLDFIDSTGIKGFITFIESLTKQNKTVKVKNIKPEINEIFELLDIYEMVGKGIFDL